MALPDFPDYNKWGFSLVALNNDVYVTGQCQGWGGGCKEQGWRTGDSDMSMRHSCGARGSSLSKILSVLSAWANLATGKEYPGTAALGEGDHLPCLSLGGSRGSQNDTWSTTQAWCFCPRDGVWKAIASMLRARTNHTSAVLNGEIYVIGGKAANTLWVLLGWGPCMPQSSRVAAVSCHPAGTTVDVVEVERYDPYNKSWCAISPAPKYVSNFAAASCLGKLYLVGSCAVKYNALTLQCYNPVQGKS